MKARSFECRSQTPMSDEEIFQKETQLYKETGKGLVHPNDFAEIHVRNEVSKHLERKYTGSKRK